MILLGEEDGLAEAAAELGVKHLPQVERTPGGTPLVSSMFALAREQANARCCAASMPISCCCPRSCRRRSGWRRRRAQFLIVGQRWDLDVREALDFAAGWDGALRQRALEQGKLHKATGSDYFIFPRDCFTDMPAFRHRARRLG